MPIYWLLGIYSSIKGVDFLFYQIIVLLLTTAYYFIFNRKEKLATQLLWAYLTIPIFFIKFNIFIYLPIVIYLICRAYWLYKREIIDDLPHDKNNIILAFYKGEKCKNKMLLWSLIDMPVKSMCVINGDKVLKIENNVYVLESSKKVLTSKNYIRYDTGVKANDDILKKMKEHVGIENQKSWFYSDCIETISFLLYAIRADLKPNSWLDTRPSFYFRKVLGSGR